MEPNPGDSDLNDSYKRQLAKSFSRAALTYDHYSLFQQQVLMNLISKVPEKHYQCAMDLGCGTGNALLPLSVISNTLIGLDLSVEMLKKAQDKIPNSHFVCADAEQMPFAKNYFDLIFSSLAIQWCLSHYDLFKEVYRVMNDGGYWCFSTLCEGSMPEIGESWSKVDGRLHSNQYPSLEKILSDLEVSGFCIESQEIKVIKMHFDSVQNAVYSVKKVGASVIANLGDRARVTPSTWRTFVNQYNELHDGIGVPLSYQVAFIVAKKVL